MISESDAQELDAAARMDRMVAAHRRLRSCTDIGDLFARAAELVCEQCGFERGVVLSVAYDQLSAAETGSLRIPAADVLRRTLLAEPLALVPDTEEHELVRRASQPRQRQLPSALAARLELSDYVLAAVAPETNVLALLVVDRAGPPVTPADAATVNGFASLLALEVEHVVLRTRVSELLGEVRHFATFAQALAREVRDAPVALPTDRGLGPAFPRLNDAPAPKTEAASTLFSERELMIANLLVEGRSNREIADELVLSPETVKSHVARILRKLGAANRVEAVSRYLRLSQGASA